MKKIATTRLIRHDIIAGITVALVLIPQSLAYAQLAGLPPQYGLYSALIPTFLAAIFGSSLYLSTGPVAVLSLMTASVLSLYHLPGTVEYISLALILTFMLGIFQITLSFLKIGNAISLLSHPVIYGFTNAAALIIASTQLPKLLGITAPNFDHQYQIVIAVFQKAYYGIEPITFLIGVWVLFSIIFLRIIKKDFPSLLFIMIGTTLFTRFIGYRGAVVGDITAGLPTFTPHLLSTELIFELLPTVAIMGIVGYAEAISIAQYVAKKTKTRLDPNKELFGQGIANLMGSFFQSFPTSGSFSRTALNFQAGARTNLSSITSSIMVLITLLFFTKLLYYLPQVVLAAVILISVSSLIDIKKIKLILLTSKPDAFAALITFLSTLYFAPHLERGIIIGVLFTIGYYIYKNVHPRVVFLSKYKDGWFHDANTFNLRRCKNISIVRFDGQLFFANASFIEAIIMNDLSRYPKIHSIILMTNGVNSIDSTGEHMLYTLWKNLQKNGKTLYISSLKSQVKEVLDRTGLIENIGNNNIFPTLDDAVKYILNLNKGNQNHTDTDNCPLEKYIMAQNTIGELHVSTRNILGRIFRKLSPDKKILAPQLSFLQSEKDQTIK